MIYLDYKENRVHGTFDFPFAFYGVTPLHPRYNMIYHWHTENEIILVKSGELHLTLDGSIITARAGDALFITGGVLHGGTPENCDYECIVFDMKVLPTPNNICGSEILSIISGEKKLHSFFPSDNMEIQPLILNMFEAARIEKKECQLYILGILYCFFSVVLRNNYYHKTDISDKNKRRIKQLKSVFSLIKTHYQDNLTLKDMAECSGMNSRYFCRFFKAVTNMTPVEYLNYYRIECACDKISAADMTITEIAYSCGFNDISYFTKVFKKYRGITPSKYKSEV